MAPGLGSGRALESTYLQFTLAKSSGCERSIDFLLKGSGTRQQYWQFRPHLAVLGLVRTQNRELLERRRRSQRWSTLADQSIKTRMVHHVS